MRCGNHAYLRIARIRPLPRSLLGCGTMTVPSKVLDSFKLRHGTLEAVKHTADSENCGALNASMMACRLLNISTGTCSQKFGVRIFLALASTRPSSNVW